MPVFTGALPEVQPKSTVIVIDMDDVMSIRQKPGLMDFADLCCKLTLQQPCTVLTALQAACMHICQKGWDVPNELKKLTELNGAGNVVHAILKGLNELGWGDFTTHEYDILERSIKPKPIHEMVNAIKTLKEKGHILIGATNHDWRQEIVYRKKMRGQGVDPNELFDAVLVTRVNHICPEGVDYESFYQPFLPENMYVAKQKDAYKPHDSYFRTLSDVVSYIARKKGIIVEKTIFTDDKKENADAAKKAHLDAIHFDLSGGSARKTSPEDLQKTITEWKGALKKHGIQL